MNDLIELAKVVNKQKIKQIDILDKHRDPSLLVNKLYDAILDGKATNEKDACIFLYGSTQNIPAFKDVKNRLRNKLYNTLFFIDLNQPNFNDHRKAQYELHKLRCIVAMLYERQLSKEAISLCEKILPITSVQDKLNTKQSHPKRLDKCF